MASYNRRYKRVATGDRWDVETNAGRRSDDFFRIASDLSTTAALGLQRILQDAGWQVRAIRRPRPGSVATVPE